MKRNIQINLFGTVYNIDEDAYQLLERYLEGMKRYFSAREGGDEIVDDIEHRVAELLWQKKTEGMEAVNIETVREIIGKIGNAQDIDGVQDGEAQSGRSYVDEDSYEEVIEEEPQDIFCRIRRNIRERRLYRNAKDRCLGGVCSGLADYVGSGDVTLWRISFVVMPFVLGWVFDDLLDFGIGSFWYLPLIYLLMWIIVPVPVTPEDRLRMKGCKVNAENINAELLRESAEDKYATAPKGNSGCLKVLFVLALLLLLFPALMVIVALLAAFFGVSAVMIGGLPFSVVNLGKGYEVYSNFFDNDSWLLLAGIIAGLLVVGIPIFLIIKRLVTGKFGRTAGFVSLALWLIAVALCIVAVVFSFIRIHDNKINMYNQQYSLPADSTDIQPVDTIGAMEEMEEMEELEDTVVINLWS